MSGEYFDIDESKDPNIIQEKSDEQINNYQCGDCPKMKLNDDTNLHEMGEALEIAENRCNTLKEQLDQMRNVYRTQSNLDDSSEFGLTHGKRIPRQNSECIRSDNSGAAVLTINNILNGITNSINRLSELNTYMDFDNEKVERTSVKERQRPRTGNSTASRETSRKSKTQLNNEKKKDASKKRTLKQRNTFTSSSSNNVKKVNQSPVNKRPKSRVMTSGSVRQESSTSVKQRKSFKKTVKPLKRIQARRLSSPSANLVEIYHNNAINSVDSDDLIDCSNLGSRNCIRSTKIDVRRGHSANQKKQEDSIAEIKIDAPISQVEPTRSLSPIQEQENIPKETLELEIEDDGLIGSKSYETPTISSKMKQVNRGYFRNIACRSIPFCAAKSITPSHNIGINIQQVMSLLKGKQNGRGISATLAHNIALAADRLNRQSLPGMLMDVGNQLSVHGGLPCPMQTHFNLQQLQEMAQRIPDYEIDDEEINNDKYRDYRQDAISWSVDPKTKNNCTCADNSGVDFNQIIDKYQISTSLDGHHQSGYSQSILKKSFHKYKHVRSVYAQYNESHNRRMKRGSLGELSTEENAANLPLGGKEKVLKAVLLNLHEEFVSISEKHDELSKIIGDDEEKSNPDDLRMLETLEKKLNNKETEIQVVMSLYNEVLNLKQQLRTLTEKAYMSNAMLQRQRQQFYGASADANNNNMALGQFTSQCTTPYGKSRKDSLAAVHLTRLLRQIQAYQDSCK